MNNVFADLNPIARQELAAKMITLWMHQKFKNIEPKNWGKPDKGCIFESEDLEGKKMIMNADIYAGSMYNKAWDDKGNWQFPNVQMPRWNYEDAKADFQIIIDPEMNGCIVAPRDKMFKINQRTYAAKTEDCVAIKF